MRYQRLSGKTWRAGFTGGGLCGTDGAAAARAAVDAGGGRAGGDGEVQFRAGDFDRRVRLRGGGYFLVLPGALSRAAGDGFLVPDHDGAGFVRSPDGEYVHALWVVGRAGGEIRARPEHDGAAAGGNVRSQSGPFSARGRIGRAALREQHPGRGFYFQKSRSKKSPR